MKNSLTITFLILCFFSLFTWTAQAQNRAIHVTSVEDAHEHTPGRNCHAHINLQQQLQADPALEQRMLDMEARTQNYIRQRSVAGGARFTSRTIPVYVHVIYRTSQENISTAQIQSQIDQINADFAATNADANQISGSGFASVAAGNTNIQFVLAPNGITRKSSSRTSWGTNDAMKDPSQGGVAAVTPNTHLNMWVCNIGGGILGYAQFPNSGPASTDGVVMSPQYFGSNNYGSGYYLSAPFDRGRTTTHEIGHYLNLRHIWGDGGCGASDLVGDTPDADGSNGGCPSIGKSSCGSVDMHMNYMDYTNDACMYMFSNGQKLRMHACLDGVRSQLGTTGGGGNPPTCNDNELVLTLDFDDYASETSWSLKDASGGTIASGNGYSNGTSDIVETFCLPDGCYDFTINDSYGDGICCDPNGLYGNGSYSLVSGGTTLAVGGTLGSSDFTSTETQQICFGGGGGGNPPSSCATTVSSFPYSESFDGNVGAWEQSSSDDIDWTVRSGRTPSSNTGPSSAVDGSHYIYTEASSGNDNKTAILTSPCFDFGSLSSSATISFQYHMYGSRIGNVKLEASTDGGSSWSTLWSESGDQGNSWSSASVTLAGLAGQSGVKLRFNGRTGSSWQSDIALDDFVISSGSTGGGGGTGGGSGCTNVTLDIDFDDYANETSWELRDGSGNVLYSGDGYSRGDAGTTETFCLPAGCYEFEIFDSWGDGMCCDPRYGDGSYQLIANGVVLAQGGSLGASDFTDSETKQICVGGANRSRTTDIVETTAISLYPNPANTTINVDLGEITTNYTGRIVDATGRTVWVGELEAGANAINIASLSTGMYYVAVVKANGEVITKKFVKK